MAKAIEKKDKFHTDKSPTWCPGCGDFSIWMALKEALEKLQLEPEKVVIVYGIGCSGNMANYVRTYGFHGLHGRALPVGEAVKMINPGMTVIVVGGDGDGLGEGIGHFLHSVRGNHDLTYIIHDNQVYGLTTGQTAPTSAKGFVTKSTPFGVLEEPVNAAALALAAGGHFVARGFAGEQMHLVDTLVRAIQHPGFSLVDVLQPCVTFNDLNTYAWFFERIYKLEESEYAPNDRMQAMVKAMESATLPIGVMYEGESTPYHLGVEGLDISKPLAEQKLKPRNISTIVEHYL
ncbi:MAG: 2-oxoacid:ferredoxin oxidoreductase subunit beta [Candidatus Nomurabacteria bacterium]|nr:MAG: 2-oxoacid:ferredoxin oxidoreductase subunit beta [Candidatus Nomurabacteria bacterium]